MEPIKTILVPVDFDGPSEAALDTALRFARNLEAKVILLHVEPFKLADVPEDVFYEGPNASSRARTNAMAALSALAESRASSGIAIKTELREGIAWDEILGATRSLKADMIVMGTHGRKGLTRGILGSVAEHVLRNAKVPVMTIRADEP
jgi:nucleotide-binding universal stress UspA family protein